MLKVIRTCSKNEAYDSLDDLDSLYIDTLETIDKYLSRARDPQGNWSELLLPFDQGKCPLDNDFSTILSHRRRLVKHRVATISEALKNGTTPSVTEDDLASAKEAGFNFNTLCSFWLSEVDVNENDFPTQGSRKGVVAKFLNRVLGLSLPKQRMCK